MKSKEILKNIMEWAAVAAIMVCSFMLPDAANAATMPTFDSLPSISVQNSTSNRDLSNIAVGVDGQLYVTESNRHNIAVLTGEGIGIGNISGITNPLGIAINSKGNVYVSSLADKSVVIRSGQGAPLGQLGAGRNEFMRPVFLAIDQQNDEVYVVDANAFAIKVYSETGTFLRTIADANSPISAAVYGNELYVLDQPLVNGVATAKIRVYNKITGAELTSFGTYGIEIGQMKQPKAITVDASGRLFVVEYFHRVVYCYDGPNRLYLGAVYNNANNALAMPMGVGVSKNGKLFVVDRAEDKLKVFGLDNYTVLNVSPDSFSFSLTNGVSTPSSGTLSLGNTGRGILSYAISATTTDGAAWIQLSGTSGTIPAISGTAGQTVTMNGTGLAAGSYTGTITVKDVDNSTMPATIRFEKKIPVTLTVNNPAFQISATTMAFETAPESSALISKELIVTLSGDSTNAITWMATAATNGTGNWLSVSPSARTGNSVTTVTVTADPTGLAAGIYDGTVTFRATDASGSPAALQVSLTVKANGTITVSTNKQKATFFISGPNGMSLSGSGKAWSQGEMPDGSYTISYGDVAGFITPDDETKTLSLGGILPFTGVYGQSKNIVVASRGSKNAASKISIFNKSFAVVMEITPFGPKYMGDISVATGDVDGDGYDEIIAAYGAGKENLARIAGFTRIAVFKRDGTKLAGSDFYAFGKSFNFGARVAAGDFDGDGKAEIVVGAGPGSRNTAAVRIFSYSGGIIKDTGVYTVPFGTHYGVNVAAGDIDGDGVDELIVAPGPDPAAAPAVTILKIDTKVAGSWAVRQDSALAISPFAGAFGANIAAGDLDGDGIDEVIAGTGTSASATEGRFAAFRGDGSPYGLLIVDGAAGGIELAAGDINEDGRAEIVTAYGLTKLTNAAVKIYGNGELLTSFGAGTNTANGAKVAVGNLGY
ncbi:MAG: FG-GAP-like repeat-containing protein [Nitrospirota bacterium]|nr:FG-GAP-like repeat-containing protein [Nitrospirota bacterium]